MHIAVVTLFPGMLDAVSREGVVGRAIERGGVRLTCVNPRDHSRDRHRTVDDRPYGGGPGMVMTVEPLRTAIRTACEVAGPRAHRVFLGPQGRRLDQEAVRSLVARERLVLVCGRYEGIDERLIEMEADEEISIGDFVLSGGEVAALAVIEAMVRLVPGVLGHAESAEQDSFSDGLLDCPHYSRPETVDGRCVPEVLLGGNHEAIRRWRLKQSLGRTWLRRPDMLGRHSLSDEQQGLLREFVTEHRDVARGAAGGDITRVEQ